MITKSPNKNGQGVVDIIPTARNVILPGKTLMVTEEIITDIRRKEYNERLTFVVLNVMTVPTDQSRQIEIRICKVGPLNITQNILFSVLSRAT